MPDFGKCVSELMEREEIYELLAEELFYNPTEEFLTIDQTNEETLVVEETS